MSGRIHFRRADQTDILQLVNLFNSQYARKKGESYFLWQYFKSYYPTVLFCAFSEDKLIGMYGLQERLLNNGAKVGQAIDMLISPEFRGKGIFKKLADHAVQNLQNIDLLCVFPNLNGKKAIEKLLGWETIGKIDSMCVKPQSITDMSSEEDSEPWRSEQDQSLCMFVYNNEIRKWRFGKHPDYIYHYISINKEVHAVTKLFTDTYDGRKFGDIVEFKCDLGNKALLTDLFIKTCHYLKNQDVEGITTWALPYTVLHGLIKKIGFLEIMQERYFCIKVLKTQYKYLTDISCWHLVQADSEIY